MYAGSGSTAEEVGVFTAKDSNQAKETMEDVQKYLDDQADSFQDYVPEETKRIGNAVLEQKNQYVVLCVSGDSDQAKEIIEKSIPIIAETLEAIRNHMIFTQYHLLHNEMQKEVIHDWMNHFNPILNKYNTVKKKLKAKVTERKELNVQKDKTSILNPIQHIKLNQQLTTITEEIEELKSRKEQLIFQAECSTDKDMTNLSKKYDQMNNNLDILDSQDISLKKQLEKDAAAFREEKFRPEPEQYTELLDTRIQIRPDFRDKLIEQLKGTFGKYYDYHRRDIAANEVDYLNVEDPDVFSHRAWELEYQRKQEIRRNQPARTKKKSYDMEL